jgi:hypothetical protein
VESEQKTTLPEKQQLDQFRGIPKPNEISLPVSISPEGEVVFAHLRFDSNLRKEFLTNLRGLLEAMEKTLP